MFLFNKNNLYTMVKILNNNNFQADPFQAIQFSQTVLIQTIQFSISTVSMSKTVLFQVI